MKQQDPGLRRWALGMRLEPGLLLFLVSPQLVLGPSGVLQGIRPGKCYVDMSTVDADTVTELAQVVASLGWPPAPYG